MASNKDGREFDFVIFGATGFTGKHVVAYVSKLEEEELKWAVAGRNQASLKKALEEVSSITGKNLKNIPVIEADVSNEKSLADMCQRAKLIINCVGPYRLWGEPVVKACVQNGSHHIDISGEPQFLESMQLKYHEEARKANVYILGSAGFDSIPCETGVQFLQQNFDGDVNTVEVLLKFVMGEKKHTLNFGTLHSIIYHIAHEEELKALRKKLFTEPLPVSKHPPTKSKPLSFNNEINKWGLLFPSTDGDVINRTQYYNYHHRRMRPLQMGSYWFIVPNLFLGILMAIMGAIFFAMVKLKCGRYLLKNHTSLFTLGMFSKDGPTKEQIEGTSFDMFIVGHGYDNKLSDPNEQHAEKPNKTVVIKVSGPEPAYAATPICMVQTALVVLKETEKLPEQGGVFSPGAALLNTTLISRLRKDGITYEVIKK